MHRDFNNFNNLKINDMNIQDEAIKMGNKVTIEITASGWTTTVSVEGKGTLVEKYRSAPYGARRVQGDFENEDILDDELCDAISSFTSYDIMRALANES